MHSILTENSTHIKRLFWHTILSKYSKYNAYTIINLMRLKRIPFITIIVLAIRTLFRIIADLDGLLTSLSRKPFKARYKRIGHCKRRGICCNNLGIKVSKGFWCLPINVKFLINWYKITYNFQLVHINRSQRHLTFKCKYLVNNKCSIYSLRPYICRRYPSVSFFTKTTLENNCGYGFKRS